MPGLQIMAVELASQPSARAAVSNTASRTGAYQAGHLRQSARSARIRRAWSRTGHAGVRAACLRVSAQVSDVRSALATAPERA